MNKKYCDICNKEMSLTTYTDAILSKTVPLGNTQSPYSVKISVTPSSFGGTDLCKKCAVEAAHLATSAMLNSEATHAL